MDEYFVNIIFMIGNIRSLDSYIFIFFENENENNNWWCIYFKINVSYEE